MELMIGLLLLIALDLAALRWGADTRETLTSAEEWLAGQGFAWRQATS
jgi:hypothetical protein